MGYEVSVENSQSLLLFQGRGCFRIEGRGALYFIGLMK